MIKYDGLRLADPCASRKEVIKQQTKGVLNGFPQTGLANGFQSYRVYGTESSSLNYQLMKTNDTYAEEGEVKGVCASPFSSSGWPKQKKTNSSIRSDHYIQIYR